MHNKEYILNVNLHVLNINNSEQQVDYCIVISVNYILLNVYVENDCVY